jgi:hypothetical protein
MLERGHGMALGRGWWYFGSVVLPAAVGWPIFLAGAAGILLLLLTRVRQAAPVVAFPAAYYLVAGSGYGVFARYVVPVVPFLCLAAAWLTVEAVRRLTPAVSPRVRDAVIAAVSLALVAPTAYNTILLDRLFATRDNREVTGRALLPLLTPGSVIYQTGERYGHVPLAFAHRRADARAARYDAASGRFRPREPDWILVQRSPLVLYSSMPRSLEQILRDRYVLVRGFPTESRTDVTRVYDQQDAFYIPLAGLEGLRRPGPAFELYARRQE